MRGSTRCAARPIMQPIRRFTRRPTEDSLSRKMGANRGPRRQIARRCSTSSIWLWAPMASCGSLRPRGACIIRQMGGYLGSPDPLVWIASTSPLSSGWEPTATAHISLPAPGAWGPLYPAMEDSPGQQRQADQQRPTFVIWPVPRAMADVSGPLPVLRRACSVRATWVMRGTLPVYWGRTSLPWPYIPTMCPGPTAIWAVAKTGCFVR